MEGLFSTGVVVIVVVIVIAILNLVEDFSKQRQELKEKGITNRVGLKHVAGLPISEDTFCGIDSYPDRYEITADGFTFNLPKNRVTDVSVKTHKEITSHSVSSIGGAIGGAILFGPLGAVIGGRTKSHKSINEISYLVFTYLKDEEIKYLCFEIEHTFGLYFVNPLVKEFIDSKIQNTAEAKQIDL